MSTSKVSALLTPTAYRETRTHIFPSEGSLQWYIRQNRAGLVEAGALLFISGRWHVRASCFDNYVLEAGATDAQRQSASEA